MVKEAFCKSERQNDGRKNDLGQQTRQYESLWQKTMSHNDETFHQKFLNYWKKIEEKYGNLKSYKKISKQPIIIDTTGGAYRSLEYNAEFEKSHATITITWASRETGIWMQVGSFGPPLNDIQTPNLSPKP